MSMNTPTERDEVKEMADRCNVSIGRVVIWDKEGRHICAECKGPFIQANYNRPTHVDFRVSGHQARL